jgi:HSP20 family protein
MFSTDPFASLLTPFARPGAFVPPADVTMSDGHVLLTMDVPGVRSEDLSIELLGDQLFVRGERKRPELPEDAAWQHLERGFGRFERRVKVPDGVDADAITASLDDGVLSLIVPKPERLKRRAITIDSAKEDRQLETTTT